MARERMITRSIAVGFYDVMLVDLDTKEVKNELINVPSFSTLNEKQLTDVIKAQLADNLAYVKHTLNDTVETLYGMPETEFLKYAKVLPPRSNKDNTEE